MGPDNEKSLERVERWFVVVLTPWAACAFVAAASGAISKVPRLVLGPLLLTETIIPIIVYYLSGTFRAYISSIDLNEKSCTALGLDASERGASHKLFRSHW
jgi:hypothetical protein